MFIGHYAPAVLAANPKLKLWHAFLAVQLMDLLWVILVLMGIEHTSILENATSVHHYHSKAIGFSHGLVYAFVWSVLAAYIFRVVVHQATRRNALIIGGLVFSHWLLDLIVHMPDLPLWPKGPLVGFGLWAYFVPSVVLEVGIFLAAFGFYLMHGWAENDRSWKIATAVFMLIATALLLVGYTSPPPTSIEQGVLNSFVAIVVLTIGAAIIDRLQRPAE